MILTFLHTTERTILGISENYQLYPYIVPGEFLETYGELEKPLSTMWIESFSSEASNWTELSKTVESMTKVDKPTGSWTEEDKPDSSGWTEISDT